MVAPRVFLPARKLVKASISGSEPGERERSSRDIERVHDPVPNAYMTERNIDVRITQNRGEQLTLSVLYSKFLVRSNRCHTQEVWGD